MPLVNNRLATPAPPLRPTALASCSSSARRRRSRSSGGSVAKSFCDRTDIAASTNDAQGRAEPGSQAPPPQQARRLKQLAAAMARPAASPSSLRSFNLLRSLLPRRFVELCKVHLSFVIDVPTDFLDDGEDDESMDRPSSQWLWQRARDSMKLKRMQGGRPEAAVASPASSIGDLAVVDRLLTYLASWPDIEQVEGLFRKCGSASRQRRLLDGIQLLAVQDKADTDDGDVCGWSAHDLAGALKASLARLSEPLLTHRLLHYFQQVAHLSAPHSAGVDNNSSVDLLDSDDALSAVLTARRLKALRLLVQLLPEDRRTLLGRLLALLARVADATDAASRMTPESLGTVFGPALFYPSPEAGTRNLAAKFNSLLAFVIRHAEEVMEVPESVAQDANGIIRLLRRGAVDAPDEAAMPMPSLSVRFAESSPAVVRNLSGDAAAAATTEAFTRSQVAALYATVQAMPDSAKRRRLIRRFNRTNGGLPTAQPPATQASSPLISSPVFGRLFDYPMRCLSPDPARR